MIRRALGTVAVLILPALLLSCGGSDGGSPSQPPPAAPTVSRVDVSPTSATLEAGGTVQLSAVARDATGAAVAGKTVAWASLSTDVATVSSAGLVTAVAEGTASVTATVDGRTGSAAITVTPPPVATVTVTPAQSDIFEGETVQLSAALADDQGNALTDRVITWASSNPMAATVDDTGLVTAVQEGDATITATSESVFGTAVVSVARRPVASVDVTPDPADVLVGQTVQLTAVPSDADGNELGGRSFVWSTTDPAVASVDEHGLVTGEGVGSALVSATTEGVADTATVNVAAPPPLVVTQVTPDPLVEGQPATVTGTGFSATPSENIVMVGEQMAQVTQATTTSLDIVVPTAVCRPKRSETVQVSVLEQTSNPVVSTVSPVEFLDLAIGELTTLRDPDDFCLQFDEAVGAERYLFGVQAVSEVAASLTGVSVTGEVPAAAAPSRALPSPTPASGSARSSVFPTADALMWARHRSAKARFLERSYRELGPLLGSGRFKPVPAMATGPAAIPGDVEVGTEIDISFPDFDTGACQTSIPITVVVRKVSARGIFVEDKTAPANGFVDADFDQMGADLDDVIYATNVDYFGAPSDMDANDRIVVVVTPEVNKLDANTVLAFVTGGDLLPTTTCPASNEGEFYYARAPDPTGMFNAGVYETATARNQGRTLLAHEMSHIVQISRRMAAGGQFMAPWMAEGGATAAEQFNAFAFESRTGGQNLGANEVYFGDPHDYYLFMGDLLTYFGWDFAGNHVEGAPEQCTWVGAFANNPGVCDADRLIYGITFAFVQHSIDRLGAGLGGDKAIHRALVDHAGAAGFAALTAVFNEPIEDLLAPAAAMFAIDDRYTGPGLDQHQFANFNIRSIEDAWNDPDAVLAPYAHGFEGFERMVSVRGGSTAYFDLSGALRPAAAVRVTDQAGSALPGTFQIWVVRVQ